MFWFLVAVLSGALNGSFALPMKYTKKWKWEHTWGMWSMWAFLILPIVLAAATVPDIKTIYGNEMGRVFLIFAVGCCYGIGAITFGMGVHYVGMALAFAIIMGLTTTVGSITPLITRSAEASVFFTMLAGIVLILLGICGCSYAGFLRDKSGGNIESRNVEKKTFLKGLIICIIAGVTGPCLNFAFMFGDPLIKKASEMGISPMFAANPVWAIALPGAFLVNFGYCYYLISKGKSGNLFAEGGTAVNWLLTLCMGLAWTGSVVLYGIASTKMGKLGPAIGWATLMGMAIVISNFWGVFTGEWKGGGKKPLQVMLAGVVLVILGVCVIGTTKV